ncbi:unnamed protein product [Ilex paraguariensis]|uniref:Ribosomal protein S11 n=1 Tax=Ilex paraguariensis TaxID=185542 RepID=A0ABC8RQN0_9AQUA
MITQRPFSRFSARAELFNYASRIFGSRSGPPFNPLLRASKISEQSQNFDFLSGSFGSLRGKALPSDYVVPHFLGNLGMMLGFIKVKGNVLPPRAVAFSSYIHSGSPKEFETGRNTRSMDFVRGIIEENGKDFMGGPQYGQHLVEQNADIVHVKMIRNNTFVTVTDSKGNKKFGASSGCLSEMKGGPKVSRYAAEATAEHVGRLARNTGLKSVVMKVNGFTYFKKKKQAILSFREGYTHSRGDQNPIVYIEDTTRRPHNGCRLRKKRRV